MNLLNDVGHEGVHRSFDPLTHALCIFSTGQQIPPVNADQFGQNDDHKQASESDEEAQEFHHYWMQGTVGFTAVAVLAHILVWAWRPWFV